MSTENKLNVAYKQPTALDKLGAFAGDLLKDEMKGNVEVNEDTIIKLCVSSITRIAFDGKSHKLYQVIKSNFPEYFIK